MECSVSCCFGFPEQRARVDALVGDGVQSEPSAAKHDRSSDPSWQHSIAHHDPIHRVVLETAGSDGFRGPEGARLLARPPETLLHAPLPRRAYRLAAHGGGGSRRGSDRGFAVGGLQRPGFRWPGRLGDVVERAVHGDLHADRGHELGERLMAEPALHVPHGRHDVCGIHPDGGHHALLGAPGCAGGAGAGHHWAPRGCRGGGHPRRQQHPEAPGEEVPDAGRDVPDSRHLPHLLLRKGELRRVVIARRPQGGRRVRELHLLQGALRGPLGLRHLRALARLQRAELLLQRGLESAVAVPAGGRHDPRPPPRAAGLHRPLGAGGHG
mmetsp:Transcript_23974/g.63930  ORF Transcript_23974/g.63930 Transcript_23974/m.63930 type:complete len:325 (+) Transcript_23974:905-1879(+)